VNSTIPAVLHTTESSKSGRQVKIWRATTTASSAGTFTINVYSKKSGGSWATCSNGNTNMFVTTATSTTATTCERRRVSDGGIRFIEQCEGYYETVYDDSVGNPTIGYGEVIYANTIYYDYLTATEMHSSFANLVNNGKYSNAVNNFIVNNGLRCNQRQFDALVSLSYNVGTGWTTNTSSDMRRALINSYDFNTLNSSNANGQSFASNFYAFHHGGGVCMYGLARRRINELEMFFLGDYVRTMPPKRTSANNWFYYDIRNCSKWKGGNYDDPNLMW
ncbi:MAG: lysozyme, partial [Clostridia bacterium]|nr:lysozyme [Clostridia bacterium]